MNKAFTKEEDADEPPVVPARAPLPPGATNYVTTRGLALLRAELDRLEAERAELEATDEGADRHRALALVDGRRAELTLRLASATVVEPSEQPHDEVRFGATATVRAEDGAVRRYRIVGVDEADVAAGRVAFLAPLARALLGKRVGDAAIVKTPRGDEELELVAISYAEE
jgi:transcription elongation factor GreB